MAALGTRLSIGVRRLHHSVVASGDPAEQGQAANPSGYGPLTELPDWSFVDGRPAPSMKGQLRRKAQREKLAIYFYLYEYTVARPVVLLTQGMDAGLQVWKLGQQKLQEERKQEHDLKPEGTLLRSPLPNQ
ncbi:39S ribosomal protein L52, mitochondrial-like [Mus pahari]|uniref:39S ribosomal protein L52, mitochondrial-like n=1 Tax=Mus pahari TaxID=10093 RepID=UPI000A30879D|nr:39S ribosomal protein L52, mitochondrial-like [Mus pahari]